MRPELTLYVRRQAQILGHLEPHPEQGQHIGGRIIMRS
jgi:hypothetical protein